MLTDEPPKLSAGIFPKLKFAAMASQHMILLQNITLKALHSGPQWIIIAMLTCSLRRDCPDTLHCASTKKDADTSIVLDKSDFKRTGARPLAILWAFEAGPGTSSGVCFEAIGYARKDLKKQGRWVHIVISLKTAAYLAGPGDGLHSYQVNDTLEVVLRTNGQCGDCRFGAQHALNHFHRPATRDTAESKLHCWLETDKQEWGVCTPYKEWRPACNHVALRACR